MNKTVMIVGVLIGLVVVVGVFLVINRPNAPSDQTIMKKEEGAMVKNGYQGQVIAGSASRYLAFTKADYDKALQAGKIIFLDFYANWCPICRAEAPVIEAGFNGLTTDQIVGFRVNFNDNDTDADEKALAEQFRIPYQHTKVILKNGQEVARYLDQWTKEDFEKEINSVVSR